MALDLAHAHAARIHADDMIVESRQPALVLPTSCGSNVACLRISANVITDSGLT
jgi:hypothetical protein